MCRVFFLALTAMFIACGARAAYWHTDFGEAQRKAYGENRIMLVHFMSSDRGGVYERLQNEVFSKYEFQSFADRHLILMEVDFPRWKQLHPTQVKINRELADKYDGHGWPVCVIVNNRGVALGQLRYNGGGPEGFIQGIEKIAKVTDKPDAAASTAPSAPIFSGAPTGPAPQYKELALKSISGTGAKRLALINNATLGAGETGKVRLGGGEVKIRCDEIRDESVIVTVEGKGKRELRILPAGPQQAQAPRK